MIPASSIRVRSFLVAVTTSLLLFVDLRSLPAQIKIRPQSARTDDWQVIYIKDDRVGYARVTTEPDDDGSVRRIRTTEETKMTIKRFGQELTMNTRLTTLENAAGGLISYTLDVENPPAEATHTVGEVKDGKLSIETVTAGRSSRRTLDWDSTVKSPAWQDRQLHESPLTNGEQRSFRVFLPQFSKITDVRVAADQLRRVKLFDGTYANLLKVKITQSILPTMPVRAWLDESGDTLKSEMDFLGMTMTTWKVDESVAMEAIAGAELDLAVNTLVPLDKVLRPGHASRQVVYRVTTPGVDISKFLKPGETQTVKIIDRESAELTVTAADPPNGSRRVSIDSRFSKASRMIQSNDQRVSEHAKRATAGEIDLWRKCVRMEKYVAKTLSRKNFSTALASAAEVAEKLEGDCTEHAVLLAAMLRAQRIPSRVAVGLVYIGSQLAFGGHMWTEAWVGGRWIPLDATLGRGGIGAAHIKLAESDLSDDAPSPVTTFLPLLTVLGNLKIEVIQAK